jgi:hypothetical protein
MLAKLTMLILLPAGADADTARNLVGRWQSEPIKAESGKTMTVEFRQIKDKPTEEELQRHLLSFGPVVVADQVEPTKGYMVAVVIQSPKDFGPGGGKRVLVEYNRWQIQKDEYPLSLKVGELSARFARVKDAGPKEAVSGEFEYLRVTSRQLREGTVAGLKYPADGAQGTDLGALNYLGGQGWDALFQGESETVICKRRVGDRTRWEYFIAKGRTGPERSDVMDSLLKEAGSKGWELSGCHEKGEVVIFKRPLPGVNGGESKKETPKPAEFPSMPVIK